MNTHRMHLCCLHTFLVSHSLDYQLSCWFPGLTLHQTSSHQLHASPGPHCHIWHDLSKHKRVKPTLIESFYTTTSTLTYSLSIHTHTCIHHAHMQRHARTHMYVYVIILRWYCNLYHLLSWPKTVSLNFLLHMQSVGVWHIFFIKWDNLFQHWWRLNLKVMVWGRKKCLRLAIPLISTLYLST